MRGQYDGHVTTTSPQESFLLVALIQKETLPSELFKYVKELLAAYPSHSFMARWQRDQLDCLLNNLPAGHVLCCARLLRGLCLLAAG